VGPRLIDDWGVELAVIQLTSIATCRSASSACPNWRLASISRPRLTAATRALPPTGA